MEVSDFAAHERDRLRGDRDAELLRSELLSADQLKHHAVALAGSHGVDRRPGRDKLLHRLTENEGALLAAHEAVLAAVTQGQRILPAETWLLDNFYLLEQQIALVRRHLPRRTVVNCRD